MAPSAAAGSTVRACSLGFKISQCFAREAGVAGLWAVSSIEGVSLF